MTAQATLRDKMVEIGRWMHESGLIAGNDGNISCRLEDGTLLITPAGIAKGRMSPDDLMTIDIQGNTIAGMGIPSTEYRLHTAFYSQRADIGAVVHAHPVYCTAFAASGKPMSGSILPEVFMTIGDIPLARYGTPSTSELADSIEGLVAEHDVILLDHHGLVAGGCNLEEAYVKVELAEHFAKILHAAEALGGAKPLTDAQIEALNAIKRRLKQVRAEKPAVRQPSGGKE